MKYHMQKREGQIEDESILESILQQGKYAVIALCRKDEPYIVTLNYGYDNVSRVLYFHCAKKGLKSEFVCQNPNVCATIIEDKGYIQSECAQPYRSVIVRGPIEIIEDQDEKQKGLNVLIEHLEENPETVKERVLEQLSSLGFFKEDELAFSKIVSIPYAYVVYDLQYQENISKIYKFAEEEEVNLLGRFSEFKYYNADKCIKMAMEQSKKWVS